ncbi:Zn-dependent exopeptidase [Ophiobolus disseminans]|uniref:Carboxypeptidase M14B n=1 Tax=Ophiobolus disseminans TaxID=1469910 RepID=A0A6A6ZU63_9PLEO|nr:Zn-dependent exopeptidase [Ophiobolus disseminans]
MLIPPESYVRSLADRNSWIKYHDDLVSEDGRAIPYVTLSNSKSSNKKLRIWIQGGQHGDEPAGDQGVLALLGKFANNTSWTTSFLSRIDLTILPRYNVDGVEYFQRQLASNYDPNRDHASNFDPHIYVDAHECTGVSPVVQRYIRAQDLLVSANKNPNINPAIRALNEEFVSDIFAAAEEKGLRVGPYFTTSVANDTITIQEPDWHAQANHKGAGNYQSLTFLVEMRGIRLARQHFQRRVASQVLTLETITNKTIAEFDTVYSTIETSRRAFIESKDAIVVLDEYGITHKSIEFLDKDTGALVNVTVRSQNSDPSTILLTRARPRAYIFSPALASVASRLRVFGVNVTQLPTAFSGDVEALTVETVVLAKTKFEGIAGTTVTTRTARRQSNAGYAFVLLEPEGVANLVGYNIVSVEGGMSTRFL